GNQIYKNEKNLILPADLPHGLMTDGGHDVQELRHCSSLLLRSAVRPTVEVFFSRSEPPAIPFGRPDGRRRSWCSNVRPGGARRGRRARPGLGGVSRREN